VVSDTNGQYTGFDRGRPPWRPGASNNFSGGHLPIQTQLSARGAEPDQATSTSLLQRRTQGAGGLMPLGAGLRNSYNT
jgi:hypothetical protein